jgi:predicted DNA-binding transcriptional regulator YafY
MLFEEQHSACEYVLSYGTQMQVLEPSALRELVVRAAEGIVAMYARQAWLDSH